MFTYVNKFHPKEDYFRIWEKNGLEVWNSNSPSLFFFLNFFLKEPVQKRINSKYQKLDAKKEWRKFRIREKYELGFEIKILPCLFLFVTFIFSFSIEICNVNKFVSGWRTKMVNMRDRVKIFGGVVVKWWCVYHIWFLEREKQKVDNDIVFRENGEKCGLEMLDRNREKK